ncbi:MAG: amino-acid N-acetyltransferase [Flavobacterium sp.]|jgi:amino-acid N-acetyltransferase
MSQISKKQHADWFRDSSPYINVHRGKTFVLHLPGEAIEHDNFRNIVKDVLLLNSLGIRLIIVFGAAAQIDKRLIKENLSSTLDSQIRITTTEILPLIEEVIGKIRFDLEAALSKGVVNAPEGLKEVLVSSGNFLKAKPLGIVNGQDFQHTGRIRKVNTQALRQQLDANAIVLVSPLGNSPSGEIFNINSKEVAAEVASSLQSDKLIFLCKEHGVINEKGHVINEIQIDDVDNQIVNERDDEIVDNLAESATAAFSALSFAKDACKKGVSRCHLIGFEEDGALLEELFTRDGSGTQVTRSSYEQIRKASPQDVGGIIELIRPLELDGALKKRPRELIEAEIEKFIVISRDGMIVSCAALYPFGEQGELACLATHPTYRNNNRGEKLLKAIEIEARLRALETLFVLTTQSAHWFTERGFIEQSISTLPESKQTLYNFQRNSKFFEKPLD